MTSAVRRFVTALSPEGLCLLLQHSEFSASGFDGLDRRERTKRAVELVLRAPVGIRGRVEAVAGSVISLAEKGDLAERALREVCQGSPAMLAILESSRSLEERIFTVWLKNAKALDRARNLAKGHHWRNGRFHCGFEVSDPGPLVNDVEVAKEAIAELVQQAQGGRNAHLDHFGYSPEDGSGAIVHHIAVYLETPASFLMEFTDGENYPQPVLHREAREVAIDYDPRSGRLDVAGKGIGGFKIFERLAKAFSKTVLTTTEMISVTRPEWNLVAFIEGVPRGLVPPEGFSSCRVTGFALVSLSNAERRLTIRAGKGEDIYDYMRVVGCRLHELPDQTIQAITVTLTTAPRSIDDGPREVRVTLTWPNARSFENASLHDQTLIEPWLSAPPFLRPK